MLTRAAALLEAAMVILIASAQITLRSEDPNATALAGVLNVLNKTGGDLNQYRPLSAYIAYALQQLVGSDIPPFQAIRFAQCALLFSLAYIYYGQLNLHPRWRLIGIALLTGLISLQLGIRGPGGFSLDRFFDTIFYLMAAAGRRAGALGALARTFIVLNAAAVAGLWRHLAGRQPVTW